MRPTPAGAWRAGDVRPTSWWLRALIPAALALATPVAVNAAGVGSADGSPSASDGPRWMAGDLHVHTTYSHDSYGGPGDDNTGLDEVYTLGHTVASQFAVARSRGLDFLAITDHNDVRSQSDAGFGAHGVIGVRGHEHSLAGHAQILGVDHVPDHGDRSADAVSAMFDEVRAAGGVTQINHPAEGTTDPDDPDDLDWDYGHEVVPDVVEVWNIARYWQPPFPSASSNDTAVAFWERFLDAGHRIGATGGSDNHYLATTPVQGVGQPTTWVLSDEATEAGILEGLAAGRTSISWQPPAHGAGRLVLEADTDGDGQGDATIGETVPVGSRLLARVEEGFGVGLVRVVTDGGAVGTTQVLAPGRAVALDVPVDATWARAELLLPDLESARRATCDAAVGDWTTYCRDALAVAAMTSPIYLEPGHLPVSAATAPETTPASEVGGTPRRAIPSWPAAAGTRVDPPDGVLARDADVVARLHRGAVTLETATASRTWSLRPFRTVRFLDRRSGDDWASGGADFRLVLDGIEVRSDLLGTDRPPTVEPLERGGLRLRFDLGVVDRIVEAYPGVAGFRSRTVVKVPAVLSAYTLDELALGEGGRAELRSFRAGADWRDPSDGGDWAPLSVGEANTGDWVHSTRLEPGEEGAATAQQMSLRRPDGARAFVVMERNDYASSMMRVKSGVAAAVVDLARDIVYLGPIEESGHIQNDTGLPARHRVVVPPLGLEPAFVGLATGAADEAWQHHQWLVDHVMPPFRRAVTWNSNRVDSNLISTGAKDDMDLAAVAAQAAVARRLGVETFILDDGWQARSGDWCPDSPGCPEPRADRLGFRFPDVGFDAVRAELGEMDLGLWMSPMHFHSSSRAFAANPQWSCLPIGAGTAALTALQPEDGSSEAGLGTWNPLAWGRHPDTGEPTRLIDYLETRVRRAIDVYGSTYFKFDFLVWLDCLGIETVDIYQYREAFTALIDRLVADYGGKVTFQFDETNDYRLFPFESVTRGPSWFQNGTPRSDLLLHNLWSLSPWIPPWTVGQHLASNRGERGERGVDWAMATGLLSHLTFWDDLTTWTDAEVATARRWVDLYVDLRDRLTGGAVHPLLDDPLSGLGWTAFQVWDHEAQSGALIVYRQDHPSQSRSVRLVGLEADGAWQVSDALTGSALGTFGTADLAGGLDVVVSSPFEARVLILEPATGVG